MDHDMKIILMTLAFIAMLAVSTGLLVQYA